MVEGVAVVGVEEAAAEEEQAQEEVVVLVARVVEAVEVGLEVVEVVVEDQVVKVVVEVLEVAVVGRVVKVVVDQAVKAVLEEVEGVAALVEVVVVEEGEVKVALEEEAKVAPEEAEVVQEAAVRAGMVRASPEDQAYLSSDPQAAIARPCQHTEAAVAGYLPFLPDKRSLVAPLEGERAIRCMAHGEPALQLSVSWCSSDL